MKEYTTLIEVDVFRTQIFVIAVATTEHLPEWARKHLPRKRGKIFIQYLKEHPIEPYCQARTIEMSGGGSIIWLRHRNNLDVASHEATHAASHCLRARGIEHTSDTEEVFAYLQEFIFSNIRTRICQYVPNKN